MRPEMHRERVRKAVLPMGTLARFAPGLTWSEIVSITHGRQAAWWRCAVAEAETRGFLRWSKGARAWLLTPAGKAITRGVS